MDLYLGVQFCSTARSVFVPVPFMAVYYSLKLGL
jgi:hypothetical protein